MNTSAGSRLYLIDNLYCGDGIDVSRKGTRYHDFERSTDGTCSLDGIHTFCFEKAGATYQFEYGAFCRIVDSD
jgi:hypothetical protein